MAHESFDELKKKMNSSLDVLTKEFVGLRTNRASTALLEPLMIDAYAGHVPITQVGTLNTPEARLITVQVWDKSLVKVVEKAIRDANLGLNPTADGQIIRVPLPDLSQERRQEIVKIAAKYAESARIAIRSIRRDGMDHLKKIEKKGEISEDDLHWFSESLQELTDEYIKKIDQHLVQKEKDVLQV
ncbi:MAG: ribosome recycling factor [Janthinobacterium lividum]